jgi:hypothetical protein
VAYNYRSEFFVTFDRSTQLNQDAIGSLDASFAWNVTPQVALTLEGQNLLDEDIVQFAGDKIRPRRHLRQRPGALRRRALPLLDPDRLGGDRVTVLRLFFPGATT